MNWMNSEVQMGGPYIETGQNKSQMPCGDEIWDPEELGRTPLLDQEWK